MVSGELVQFLIPWRSKTDTTSNITKKTVVGSGARSARAVEDVLRPARAVQL